MEPPIAPAAAPEPVPTVDATISSLFANLFAMGVCVAAVVAIAVPHVLLWGGQSKLFGVGPLFWLGVVIALPVHEGLHGLGFQLGGAGRQGVRYGIAWSKLMPYAHCKVPLSARSYRIACALPGLVLGLLPVVVGLSLGWGKWMLFGVLMIGLAGGDAAVLWAIRRVPGESQVLDHPTAVGCTVLPSPTPARA